LKTKQSIQPFANTKHASTALRPKSGKVKPKVSTDTISFLKSNLLSIIDTFTLKINTILPPLTTLVYVNSTPSVPFQVKKLNPLSSHYADFIVNTQKELISQPFLTFYNTRPLSVLHTLNQLKISEKETRGVLAQPLPPQSK
jgi:hypothetical protein